MESLSGLLSNLPIIVMSGGNTGKTNTKNITKKMIKQIILGTLAVAAGVAAERKFKISEKVDKFLNPAIYADESFEDDEADCPVDDEESTTSID